MNGHSFITLMCFRIPPIIVLVVFAGSLAGDADSISAAEPHVLHVGWTSADITPPKPVALVGQKRKRISTGVRDPLTATVLALETHNETGSPVEQAVLVSCDLAFIRQITQSDLRDAVAMQLKDLDVEKLFLNATHTHTAPQQLEASFFGLYDVKDDAGVMTATEYRGFLIERLKEAVVTAWNRRQPGGMSWGLGQAVVGHNRRAVYFDGHTAMYGKTTQADFDRIEGYEDHGLTLLFFYNDAGRLTGIVINLACPSQETEGLSVVSADFWHDVREEIHKRHGDNLFILPQCAAAGDISPHLMFRKQAEQEMLERRGLSRREEIARRIADAVDDVLRHARNHIEFSLIFRHDVVRVELPLEENLQQPFYTTDDPRQTEMHVLRLGDVALATNPFELYLDYGIRMQARSPAALTLTVQLCCMHCGYLPTRQAVRGGGYSAVQFVVGPEGGTKLVDETVGRIQAMWP